MILAATIICLLTLFVLISASILIYRTIRHRHYYKQVIAILNQLDRKYLLSEMLPPANFHNAKILQQILYDSHKSMLENIAQYQNQLADFRDYIELWVHEVKAPLSRLALIKRHDQDRNSKSAIRAIENHINQALFYSKLDSTTKDYVIRQTKLANSVANVIKSNKDALIADQFQIQLENLEHISVHSDPKWLEFIINQIVLNAIKYRKTPTKSQAQTRTLEPPQLTISAHQTTTQTILTIRDNGIGIPASELRHVFRKGFTGSNDRQQQSSTGMGLYIAHRLATDLGHQLSISSELQKSTTLTISFGKHQLLHPAA